MNDLKINCPDCGFEFELSDALTGKIRNHIKDELEADVTKREATLAQQLKDLASQKKEVAEQKEALDEQVEEKLKLRQSAIEEKISKKLQAQYDAEMDELSMDLQQKEASIAEFKKQELTLRKEKQELAEAQENVDLTIARKLDEERARIKEETLKQADETHRLQDIDKDKAIAELRKQELELRKEKQELATAKESAELDNARKLDEERAKIKEDAQKQVEEQHRLKDLEKDKQLQGLKSALEDAKRKAEQGSMETQGEVLEQDFETHLSSLFVHDEIKPVPKGAVGADIIQSVRTPIGSDCGIILWEMKNTKTWSKLWIAKLKQDMIQTRASLAILVSVSLPEGIERFGQIDGIWVSDTLSAIPLAMALREQLIALENTRKASEGKNEKMEFIYQYLAGTEFSQKIMGIVNAFQEMHAQLQRERGSMERSWSKREKQLELIIKNTSGLYGDMQGIIGGTLQTIPALELDNGDLVGLPEGLKKDE